MDPYAALGIFLLGAGAGAMTTATFYAAQIRRLKHLLPQAPAREGEGERQEDAESGENRKSA
jgi:hypothetical protein